MKIKVVLDIDKELEKNKESLKKLRMGKIKVTKGKVLVLTPKDFHSIFSPERWRLMKTVKENRITSIQSLANALKRPYEAVYRDIKFLEGLGLMETKKVEDHRIPYIEGKIEIAALV